MYYYYSEYKVLSSYGVNSIKYLTYTDYGHRATYSTTLSCRGGVLEDVLGFDLEGLGFWSPWPWPQRSSSWPWPRSLKSSKIALSSARGQGYFLNSWNFVGKRQKPRGKFVNTFFVFLTWSIGVAKAGGGGTRGPGPPQLKFHQWQKCDKKAYCFFSFSFFLVFFAYNSN